MTRAVCLTLGVLVSLWGCAGGDHRSRDGAELPLMERVAEQLPGPPVQAPPPSTPDTLFFLGVSGKHATESAARDDALRHAIIQFSRFCGVEVSRVETHLSTAGFRSSVGSDPENREQVTEEASTRAFVSRARGLDWFTERIERFRGRSFVDTRWKVYVVVAVPRAEAERVRRMEAGPALDACGQVAALRRAATNAYGLGRPLKALGLYLEALEDVLEPMVATPAYARAKKWGYWAEQGCVEGGDLEAEALGILHGLRVSDEWVGSPKTVLDVVVTDRGRAAPGIPLQASCGDMPDLEGVTAGDGRCRFPVGERSEWGRVSPVRVSVAVSGPVMARVRGRWGAGAVPATMASLDLVGENQATLASLASAVADLLPGGRGRLLLLPEVPPGGGHASALDEAVAERLARAAGGLSGVLAVGPRQAQESETTNWVLSLGDAGARRLAELAGEGELLRVVTRVEGGTVRVKLRGGGRLLVAESVLHFTPRLRDDHQVRFGIGTYQRGHRTGRDEALRRARIRAVADLTGRLLKGVCTSTSVRGDDVVWQGSWRGRMGDRDVWSGYDPATGVARVVISAVVPRDVADSCP